jgi:hypothetical protein
MMDWRSVSRQWSFLRGGVGISSSVMEALKRSSEGKGGKGPVEREREGTVVEFELLKLLLGHVGVVVFWPHGVMDAFLGFL